MTTNRGRDIYAATEKDYDTSGYREKVCHQWLADQRGQTADFYSPTALETDKQGQTYKRQSQKFADMNEPVKGSQRYESSRERRNNNDDDEFFEPFFGYENRLNKVQTDTLKKTKHSQQMPIGQRNEKVHEKSHRQTQALVKPHRRGRDVYEEMEKDFDTNVHLKKVGHQWPVDQRRQAADFYSPTGLELDKQEQTYKRQSQKFVDINEPVKGGQYHESSRARRNNNDDEFFEPFFGYENRLNKIENDTAKPKHRQQIPKCQSDGKVHEEPHRQSKAIVKPHQKSLEKLHETRLIDKHRPDKRSTKRKNDENLDFLADFGDDHGREKKRMNDDDFVSPMEFGGVGHNNAIIKAANQGIRALKAITSSTQPTIIQIFIKTD